MPPFQPPKAIAAGEFGHRLLFYFIVGQLPRTHRILTEAAVPHRFANLRKTMWPPAVSASEIVLLAAVAVITCVVTRQKSLWLWGIVACFVIGMLVTPADPGSTLGAGGVLSIIYIMAVLVSKWLLREPSE